MSELSDALERHRRAREAFRWEVPDAFNFARDVVDGFAAERPALLWRSAAGGERRLDFGAVQAGSRRVAGLLADLGIAPGDPLIVMLPRLPEWHLVMVGALRSGALVIPCSTILRPKDLRYRVEHSGAVAVISGLEQVEAVDAVRGPATDVAPLPTPHRSRRGGARRLDRPGRGAGPGREEDPGRPTRASDPALVYYTSGTTGPPKAVLHPRLHLRPALHGPHLARTPGR